MISKKNQLHFFELFSVGPAMNLRYIGGSKVRTHVVPSLNFKYTPQEVC